MIAEHCGCPQTVIGRACLRERLAPPSSPRHSAAVDRQDRTSPPPNQKTPPWLANWALRGTLQRPSCTVLGPFASFPTFLVRLRQELAGHNVPVADWARLLRVCILGASDSPNVIRSAFLEKLDSLPSLQAAIADGTVSFDDYAAVLTSCTPEGHDRALFGDAFCSARGPQETLGQAFRRFTSACQALSYIGLSFTPTWLYLALSRLLTPSEFEDFMQRPGVEPLLRSPYKESPADNARRYGSLLDTLRSFCDMAPWRDRVPLARPSCPPGGIPSATGAKGPRPGPGNSGDTAGGSAGPATGGSSSGHKSNRRGGNSSSTRKGKLGGSRGGSVTTIGPAPCGGPSPESDFTSDDEAPPPQVAWAAAAAGTTVFYYTGNREEDARITQDRIRRHLCLRCLPGATPPHPFGACPLHDSRTGAPSCRPYPTA